MAKVKLDNYETKTNRKKLINAYSDKSAVCDIRFIEQDEEIVVMSDNNKVLCLNTEKIPLKTTKNTQGVQVLSLTKKGAVMNRVMNAEEFKAENLQYYKTKNIPAAGSYLKKTDAQISFT